MEIKLNDIADKLEEILIGVRADMMYDKVDITTKDGNVQRVSIQEMLDIVRNNNKDTQSKDI